LRAQSLVALGARSIHFVGFEPDEMTMLANIDSSFTADRSTTAKRATAAILASPRNAMRRTNFS